MSNLLRMSGIGAILATMMLSATGCVVAEPRDNYYDHPHHRYYHEHSWHECGERDEHCR